MKKAIMNKSIAALLYSVTAIAFIGLAQPAAAQMPPSGGPGSGPVTVITYDFQDSTNPFSFNGPGSGYFAKVCEATQSFRCEDGIVSAHYQEMNGVTGTLGDPQLVPGSNPAYFYAEISDYDGGGVTYWQNQTCTGAINYVKGAVLAFCAARQCIDQNSYVISSDIICPTNSGGYGGAGGSYGGAGGGYGGAGR